MGTFTYEQSVEGASGTGGGDPETISITPNAVGNLIVVHAMERSGLSSADSITISDNASTSHTWTRVLSFTDTNATTRKTCTSWWTTANTTSAFTITVDDGTSNNKAASAEEISYDSAITWTLLGSSSDGTAAGTIDDSTHSSGSTASIAAGDQLLLGACFIKNDSTGDNVDISFTSSALTGGTSLDSTIWNGAQAFGRHIRTGYLQETGAGTKSTTATIDDTTDNNGMVVSLLVFGDTPSGGGISVPVAVHHLKQMAGN